MRLPAPSRSCAAQCSRKNVGRADDPHDRRGVLVEPPPSAKRAVSALWGPIQAGGLELLERYGDTDVALLQRFLEDYCALQWSHAERIREGRKR